MKRLTMSVVSETYPNGVVYTHSAPSNLIVVQNHLQLSPVMGSLGVDARRPVPIVQWRLSRWD